MGGGGRRQGGGAGGASGHGARGDGDSRMDQVLQALRQQAAQQQRLLQALGGGDGDDRRQGQRRPGGGDGHARGGGGEGSWRRGGGLGGAGSTRTRPGDWTCSECNAFPCFGRADSCFRCNAPRPQRAGAGAARPGAAGTSGGAAARLSMGAKPTTYLGPVGAGGSRPMLGGRAATARNAEAAPSFRVPGASLAAQAEAQRAINATDAAVQLGQDDAPTAGAAGQSKGVGSGRGGTPPAAPRDAAAARQGVRCHNSWAALAEEDDEDDLQPCDIDEDGDGGGCGEHGGDGCQGGEPASEGAGNGEQQGPSELHLKEVWRAHCAVVRKLERDRQTVPPEVLESVRAQRDAAEQRWRAIKAPHPLHKRLRWAENEWRAAQLKEDARRRELSDHLEEAAARTRDIESKLSVDVARTARKRAALDGLLREGRVDEAEAMEKAAREAVTGLGTDIGPALSAIIERLGDGDQGLKEDLQVLSTSLGRVEEVLRGAAQERLARRTSPEQYDIGGDYDGDGGFDDANGGADDGDEGGRRVRRREGPGAEAVAAAPRWTQPSANAPWRRATTSSCSAVEQARRLLQAGGGGGANGGERNESPSDTNDLYVAEQRQRAQAQDQMRTALEQQQRLQSDPQSAQAEEELRRQRERSQQEEIQRHHEAAARAAAEAEAESARQREAAWAKLSPEEQEAALKIREQQAAIGAQIFGTQAASHLAGIAHQAHVKERVQADDAGDRQDVELLMRMSPEEFARWDQDRQGMP